MVVKGHRMDYRPPVIEFLEVTDPQEQAEALRQREQFDRNSAWLRHHISEVYAAAHRGKVVCVAGEEAFFGATVEDAVARASTAHPNDKGWFTRYIPRQKATMVYASMSIC
jgi:hypothetical protein